MFALLLTAARSQAQQVAVHCDALPEALHDELSARVRLLVVSNAGPGLERIEVDCDEQSVATAHYADQVRTEPLQSPIESVDSVLRSVEQLLRFHPSVSTPEESDEASAAAPLPSAASDLDRPPDRGEPPAAWDVGHGPEQGSPEPASQTRERRTVGGVGLGLSVEPWPDPASVGVGPRLDLGIGFGSWTLMSFESLRFGRSRGQRLMAFDAMIGVAWGPPFSEEPVGLALAFGREWLSATSSEEPTGARTSSVFVADLALRVSHSLGAVAIWVNIGGRFRMRELELEPPIEARLDRWSALLSTGVVLRAQ
jgi:hypothetical protein